MYKDLTLVDAIKQRAMRSVPFSNGLRQLSFVLHRSTHADRFYFPLLEDEAQHKNQELLLATLVHDFTTEFGSRFTDDDLREQLTSFAFSLPGMESELQNWDQQHETAENELVATVHKQNPQILRGRTWFNLIKLLSVLAGVLLGVLLFPRPASIISSIGLAWVCLLGFTLFPALALSYYVCSLLKQRGLRFGDTVWMLSHTIRMRDRKVLVFYVMVFASTVAVCAAFPHMLLEYLALAAGMSLIMVLFAALQLPSVLILSGADAIKDGKLLDDLWRVVLPHRSVLLLHPDALRYATNWFSPLDNFRTYGNSDWQAAVARLMKIADLIVIDARSKSEAVSWEMKEVCSKYAHKGIACIGDLGEKAASKGVSPPWPLLHEVCRSRMPRLIGKVMRGVDEVYRKGGVPHAPQSPTEEPHMNQPELEWIDVGVLGNAYQRELQHHAGVILSQKQRRGTIPMQVTEPLPKHFGQTPQEFRAFVMAYLDNQLRGPSMLSAEQQAVIGRGDIFFITGVIPGELRTAAVVAML